MRKCRDKDWRDVRVAPPYPYAHEDNYFVLLYWCHPCLAQTVPWQQAVPKGKQMVLLYLLLHTAKQEVPTVIPKVLS